MKRLRSLVAHHRIHILVSKSIDSNRLAVLLVARLFFVIDLLIFLFSGDFYRLQSWSEESFLVDSSRPLVLQSTKLDFSSLKDGFLEFVGGWVDSWINLLRDFCNSSRDKAPFVGDVDESPLRIDERWTLASLRTVISLPEAFWKSRKVARKMGN